jgi:hypothetical protein
MSEHPTARTTTLKDKDTDINVTVQRYDNYLSTSKRDDIVTTGLSKHINPAICFGKVVNRVVTVFTYLLTPWSRVPLEKLTGSQLVKKFPAFYGTRRFVTALTSARHLSLS